MDQSEIFTVQVREQRLVANPAVAAFFFTDWDDLDVHGRWSLTIVMATMG
jgi:hypothetical protein